MSYILWSKDEDCVVLAIVPTMEELMQKYTEICLREKYEFQLIEKILDRFSCFETQNDLYFTRMEDLDANEPIYLFLFHEDGEGESYHDEMYCEISNDKDALFQTAIDFFKCESRKTKQKHIDLMLHGLKTNEYYEIPYCENYLCDMRLFLFQP